MKWRKGGCDGLEGSLLCCSKCIKLGGICRVQGRTLRRGVCQTEEG